MTAESIIRASSEQGEIKSTVWKWWHVLSMEKHISGKSFKDLYLLPFKLLSPQNIVTIEYLCLFFVFFNSSYFYMLFSFLYYF